MSGFLNKKFKMGSCSSKNFIVTNEKQYPLTTSEIISLRQSLREIVHLGEDKFALELMIQFYEKYPHLNSLWWFLEEIENKQELRNNPNLLSHCQKFFNELDKIIYSLEDIDVCCSILIDLGELHFKKGVNHEHLKVNIYVIKFRL